MTSLVNRLKSSPKSTLWVTLCLLALPPLFWAGNFIVGRSVRGDIPPLTLSFDRWLIASLVLLPFTYKILRREWRLYWQYRTRIVIASITGVAAFNSFIYLGLQTTTASNALILNSFIPLLIMLFGSLFFKLTLSAKQWLGMSISFVGVLSIISRGEWSVLTSLSFNQGDMIVFLAMVSWAIYTLVIQRMPKEINRIGLMSVQMFLGLLVVLPFYLWEVHSGSLPNWNNHTLLALAYVGIVPSVLAYLLYTAGVERLGPTKVGLSIHLIPVFGVLLSIALLGESLHLYQISGMALIFLGILLS
ncbi:DMT family transporter [Vibrio fluvialis]|nr:DMT family transporter [Vibrio fluvialis]